MANVSQSANERSLRSVFVGNIPYDASEEKLKDIFSEAGPVLSFKLVYDRESGKPKGYGFCEYRDQETALSAMRNLNSYELNGRNLRVDTATNERFKEEMKNLQMSLSGSMFESPYGQDTEPEKAPEHIAKVVSSLPPEQMFEIAKQMKHCVLTNPNEARNMLLQNPQLAYALLQLLVVMRAIDVQTASSILYKPNPLPAPIPPGNVGPPHPAHMVVPPPQAQQPPIMQPIHQNVYDPHDQFSRGVPPPAHQNFDPRHLDPRLRSNDRSQEIFDPRLTAAAVTATQPPPTSVAAAPLDPRLRGQTMDLRHLPQQANVVVPNQSLRPGVPAASVASTAPTPVGPRMANQQPVMFPSNFPSSTGQTVVPPQPQPAALTTAPVPVAPVSGTTTSTSASSSLPSGVQLPPQQSGQINQSEAEKAQLIIQVLSLSDQQINMLPADQRQSIIVLRQQLQQQQQQQANN